MRYCILIVCLLLTACETPRVNGEPKPAHVLGSISVRGNDPEKLLQCVQRSLAGDGSGAYGVITHQPHSTLWFLTYEQLGQIVDGLRYAPMGGWAEVQAFGMAGTQRWAKDALRTVEKCSE